MKTYSEIINGKPGAKSYSQLTETGIVSWWTPTVDGVAIGNGGIEKYNTREEACARAVELKQAALKAAVPE